MRIITTINEMQTFSKKTLRSGKTIGFVPTMGYLHEGHMSLVEEALKQNDCVIMSIFVNPLQFGPNEDFDRYPRDLKRDEELAKQAGVDILFYPNVKEMYPKERTTRLTVQERVDTLCGESRPGHFDGVATVVMKLLQIVLPDRAYFGMKDAQQVAVIKGLVEDFNVPVEIVPCPIIREEDGLAKSSRNVYLTPTEREEAIQLSRSLDAAANAIERGETNPVRIKELIISYLNQTSGVIDYVEVLSYPALEAIDVMKENIIVAVAVQFTAARLIDNKVTTRSEIAIGV
ncbi:pantoate--beta-alanine ligase [Pseudalkalibacillus hwajinpoensis]|uniref:pantoate--beta-alanine ligase n=1 Tax=Guptibacillus hwajinpoensis TaxID=208199 RepID=UPI001CD4EFD0|nr:pantoate--beta-alanine ligase [Pseudalkalibacillus hwajinpoensis]MCA0990750.1 pantoate--beta-alanine ligase [Pseudalkalibacillus hwajinpoensis]